ncbi:MAG TPA: hypothetical protein VNZ55_11410 [Thermomicrobiales bacterium]|nr:hypothetical protein [Thermomicrobiales bacterium]
MYMPTDLLYPSLDPIEERRLQSNRPASRAEIARRVLHSQHDALIAAQSPAEEAPARFAHRSAPDSMTRVRRGISRALIAAADRIGPEAA